MDSEAELKYFSEDMKTLYYTKDDALYVKSGNKDKEKIAEGDDVNKVIGFGGKEVYFFNDASTTGTAADYVDDDMKSTDDAMVEPVAPEYPKREYRTAAVIKKRWLYRLGAYYAREIKRTKRIRRHEKNTTGNTKNTRQRVKHTGRRNPAIICGKA